MRLNGDNKVVVARDLTVVLLLKLVLDELPDVAVVRKPSVTGLVARANILDNDVADAGFIDDALLRLDEGVGTGDNDGSFDTLLDDVRARGLEVVVDGAVGSHVVACLAAEGVECVSNKLAGHLATEVPEVGETWQLERHSKHEVIIQHIKRQLLTKVLGTVDGGAKRNSATDDLLDARLGHRDINGVNATLRVADNVNLGRAGALLDLLDERRNFLCGVLHVAEAADEGYERVRSVRLRVCAPSLFLEVLLEHVDCPLAVRGEAVKKDHFEEKIEASA